MNWAPPLIIALVALLVAWQWPVDGIMRPFVRIFFFFLAIVLSIIVWLIAWWLS